MEKPTPWVSSLVLVKKSNGKLRLCLDPKPLNEALQCSQFRMPTLEDILPELSHAKVFSVVDVKNGYWHIALDEDSRSGNIRHAIWKVQVQTDAFWTKSCS